MPDSTGRTKTATLDDRARRLLELALHRIDAAVGGECADVASTLAEVREALAAVRDLRDATTIAGIAPGDEDPLVQSLEADLAAVSQEERLLGEAAAQRAQRRAQARLAVDEDERMELERLSRDRERAQAEHERRRQEWEAAHAASWARYEEDLEESERDIRARAARRRAQLEREDEADRDALRAQLDRVRSDKAWIGERLADKRAAAPDET